MPVSSFPIPGLPAVACSREQDQLHKFILRKFMMTNSEPGWRRASARHQQLMELAEILIDKEDAIRNGEIERADMMEEHARSVLQRLHRLGTNLEDLPNILAETRAKRDARKTEEELKVAAARRAEEERLAAARRAEEERLAAARRAEAERQQAEAVADDVNRNEVGTLEIQLADDIAAHQLAAFLTITNKFYFDSLWLQRAEETTSGVFPDDYIPSEAEELWINRLEIGTPNLVEFVGNLSALGEVAQYLAAFLGTATTATLTSKAYGDLKLKQAKANLINAKAERLRARGKITHTYLS
jgi:hypothetical protein